MIDKIEQGKQLGIDKRICRENINKYHLWDDVVKNFPGNYGIGFEDISTLKGQRIFNVELYIEK